MLILRKYKMELEKYKEVYEKHSGTLSNINRQIAFAGIAIIWIFKKTNGVEVSISSELLWAAIFIIAALFLDMIHYLYLTIVWSAFYNKKEKEGIGQKEDVESSTGWNLASWIFFYSKVGCVFIACSIILFYLINYFNFT